MRNSSVKTEFLRSNSRVRGSWVRKDESEQPPGMPLPWPEERMNGIFEMLEALLHGKFKECLASLRIPNRLCKNVIKFQVLEINHAPRN